MMPRRTRLVEPAMPDRAWILVLALSILLTAAWPSAAAAQEAYSLGDLLRIGRERSPTVLALRAEAAARAADRRDAGRLANPELEYERGSGSPFEGTGSRTVEGFVIRQEIENPLTRHHRLGALSAMAAASDQGVRSGVLAVDYEVRLHFHRILYLERLVEAARLNAEALAGIRELVEARARVGEVKEMEAIRLRVEHLRAANEAEAALLELDQYRRHLNTFLGNVLAEDFTLVGELEAGGVVPDLQELVARSLPEHPELLRAERESDAAGSELRASQTAWLPDPVLSGASQRELDGEVRTLGISLAIPLWNQSRAAAEAGRQRLAAAQRREEALELELEAQLMIHLNHLKLNRQTLQLFQEGLLEEAEASMQIAETSYREGEISLVEYLDARRTYRSIQIDYHQALFDWNVEWAALELAAGGGVL
jgi:cobalt-zinc-cadmium efflux system outer membrane protein